MHDDLETLLADLPLRRPPASLDARIMASRPATHRRLRLWPIAGGVAAAAAVVLYIVAAGPPQTTAPGASPSPGPQAVAHAPAAGSPAAVAVAVAPAPGQPVVAGELRTAPVALTMTGNAPPVRVEKKLTHLRYEGVVTPDSRTPLMKFRRQVLDEVETFDAARGRRVESAGPSEDIIMVKAPVY